MLIVLQNKNLSNKLGKHATIKSVHKNTCQVKVNSMNFWDIEFLKKDLCGGCTVGRQAGRWVGG